MAINSFSNGNFINSLQAAGKNAVINGGMDIWQRGTSTTTSSAGYYSADRWASFIAVGSGTVAQDTTNVPDGLRYGLKFTSSAINSGCNFYQTIETANTIPLVNKTVSLSFYISGDAANQIQVGLLYSTTVDAAFNTSFTTVSAPLYSLTATPTRYTITATVPSTAKTLQVFVGSGTIATSGKYFSITGVQLELGSTATTFSRAGGTIQGELAACQRYYYRFSCNTNGSNPQYTVFGWGWSKGGTNTLILLKNPQTLRTNPTAIDYSTLSIQNSYGGNIVVNSATIDVTGPDVLDINVVTASSTTAGTPWFLGANNSTSAYIGVSAEL